MKCAVVLALCSFLLVSCIGKSDRKLNHDKKDEPKIGFSIDTLIVERWRQDCDVFVSTAKESGTDVIIQDAANSVQEQIRQIEYLIGEGVKALVIVAKESDSLSQVLQKARAKNIPVIAYDRLIRNADISLYVTINSQKVGRLMAGALKNVQPEGGYWCIYGSEADYNMTMINEGVMSVLSGTNISVDLKYYTPDWNYDIAYQKMNGLLNLNLHPTAVICGNDAVAENVIRALSEHKLGKTIPVVGQDAEVLACRRIADGIQTATVYKPITDLAIKAAQCACFLAQGHSVEEMTEITEKIDNGEKMIPVIYLEPVLVTKDNLSEVVIDSGFHSANEIFR